jgi:hypothetical protein
MHALMKAAEIVFMEILRFSSGAGLMCGPPLGYFGAKVCLLQRR